MIVCSSLDTMVTPLTDRYFSFSDLQNGYLLLFCGSLSFVSYFTMQLPLQTPPEHILLLFGVLADLLAITGTVTFFGSFPEIALRRLSASKVDGTLRVIDYD